MEDQQLAHRGSLELTYDEGTAIYEALGGKATTSAEPRRLDTDERLQLALSGLRASTLQ